MQMDLALKTHLLKSNFLVEDFRTFIVRLPRHREEEED